MTSEKRPRRRLGTGVSGLDEVLHGGLISGQVYMVTGDPGSGKTILGLHFLTAGVENDESVLFVGLEESEAEIRRNAASLGFDLAGVQFVDLTPTPDAVADDRGYDVFSPAEVEGDDFFDGLTAEIDDRDPDRLFVDPLTKFRLLTPDEYQFRKRVLAFKQALAPRGTTVLFTAQRPDPRRDATLPYLSDGTIELVNGSAGRTVRVPKFRGSDTSSGDHAVEIRPDGLSVYPNLVPGDHERVFDAETLSFGIPELDELLGGGLERGTITVLSGPSGVGKTTLGTQFVGRAAERGERSVVYLFEEGRETFLTRSDSVDIPASSMVDSKALTVEEVEAIHHSPQKFAQQVRAEVEERKAEIVMIDGISGYELTLQNRTESLVKRLHALSRYLVNMGVTVILVDETDAVTGEFRPTNAGISYLADSVVFLRHVEVQAELKKTIGVLKKRTTDFEQTMRELEITADGLALGEPLTDLQGILSGSPRLVEGPPGGDP
jgi:circadian clock protein KaiC